MVQRDDSSREQVGVKPDEKEGKLTNALAGLGDRIIFKRADGKYDVLGLDKERQREVHRDGLPDLETAHDLARAGLEDSGGTQVWVCDHSAPDVIEPY
jgi:hypothetical protein